MKILVLGSLPKDDERKKFYESIVEVCSKYSEDVSSPIDTVEFEGNRYERALQKVDAADLIIGDQSKPSTGQGFELGYSLKRDVPIIILAETGSAVSGLMEGCPQVKEVIYYDSVEDLKEKLDGKIREMIG